MQNEHQPPEWWCGSGVPISANMTSSAYYACVCANGFVHDTMGFRIRNCYLTQSVRIGLYTILAMLTGLTGVYGIYLTSKSVNKARYLCLASTILCFDTALYEISGLALNDTELASFSKVSEVGGSPRSPSWTRIIPAFFYIGMFVIITSFLLPYTIWALLQPAYEMYKKQQAEVILRRRLLALASISGGLGICTFISMSFVHDNDKEYNFRLTVYIIVLLVVSPCFILSVAISAWKIQREIMALSLNSSSDDYPTASSKDQHPVPQQLRMAQRPTSNAATTVSMVMSTIRNPRTSIRMPSTKTDKLLHFHATISTVTRLVLLASVGGGCLVAAYTIPIQMWNGYPYQFVCHVVTMTTVIPLSLGLYTFTIRKLQMEANVRPERPQTHERAETGDGSREAIAVMAMDSENMSTGPR